MADAEAVPQNTQDLTVFVQNLLQQMVSPRSVPCLACLAATVLPALPNACITAKHMHSDGSVGMGEQQQRFQDMSDAIISRSKSPPPSFPAGLAILVLSAPRKGLRGGRGVEFGALNGSQRLSGA